MTAGDNRTAHDIEKLSISLGLQVGAYIIVMIIALVGNLLVLLTYKNDELRRLVMAATVCHLAVADLITAIFGIPSMISLLLNDRQWLIPGKFGDAVCKMYSYAFEVAVAVSAISIAIIAIERFLSVFFPLKRILTVRSAHITGAIVWVVSLCFYVPKVYVTHVANYGNNIYCTNTFSKFRVWRKIEASCFGLLFLITLVLYIAIVIKVILKKAIPGHAITENNISVRARTNRRVIRQGLGVITAHYLCWLPYLWIYITCVVFRLRVQNICVNMGIFQHFFIFFLGFSNSALNPILYTATNSLYRKGCKNVLRNLCRACTGAERVSPVTVVCSKNSRGLSSTQNEQQQQQCQQQQQQDQLHIHAVTNEHSFTRSTLAPNDTQAFEMRSDHVDRVQEPMVHSPRVIVVSTQ